MKNKVAAIRKRINMTQCELADKCGASQQWISRVELGKCEPSLKMASVLARTLGCTIDELFAAAPDETEAG